MIKADLALNEPDPLFRLFIVYGACHYKLNLMVTGTINGTINSFCLFSNISSDFSSLLIMDLFSKAEGLKLHIAVYAVTIIFQDQFKRCRLSFFPVNLIPGVSGQDQFPILLLYVIYAGISST